MEQQQLPDPNEWLNKQATPLPSPEEWLQKNAVPSEVTRSLEEKVTPGNVDIAKKVAPYVVPAAGIAAGTAASAAVPPVGLSWLPGLVGSGTMAAIENLLQPKSKEESHGYLADTAIDTAKNEGLGRIISGVTKGAGLVGGGVIAKIFPDLADKLGINTIDASLAKLKPTTAQITGNKLLEFVENNFGKTSKEAALVRSGKMSQEEANNLIQRITGRSDVTINTPFKQAENIEANTLEQFKASQEQSTARGNSVKLIADSKRIQIPIYQQVQTPPSNVLGPNGQPITGATTGIKQVGTQEVRGPIVPTNLLNEAKVIMAKIENSLHKPDPNSPLMKDLDSILLNAQTFDANGNVVPKPLNFKDAWQSKQDYGDNGFANPTNSRGITDVRYKDLYKAINQDIEESIPKWGAGPDVELAKRQFGEAKIIANNRHKLFDEKPIEKLVNEETNSVPSIDNIIHNPKVLAKSLATGTLVIPEGGDKTYTGIKYITNNTRQDLGGYELGQLIKKAQIVDKQGNTRFDGQKLLDNFHALENQESYKQLWSAKHRGDIEQFFKNLAMTSDKLPTTSNYRNMKLGVEGISLLGGLATSIFTGSPLSGLIPAGIIGVDFGASQLNKLLTNPDSARMMVSLAQNAPLNMSVGLAGRVIANVLKNQKVTLVTKDGSKVEGKLNANREFVLPIGEQK